MKRNSVPTIILLIVSYIAVSVLLSFVCCMLTHMPFGTNNIFFLIFLMFFFMGFPNFTNLFLFPVAKRTMNKGTQANNFGKTTTYITKGGYRIKSIICIDEETGRVAYTSSLSPFKFQMAEAKELSKVRTGYERAPLGGTRYVFFEFYYKNNRMRIPTFYTSRIVYSIASQEVQDALAAGENICNLILKFNPLARLTADKINNREMPFIKIGVPSGVCGAVSVYVALWAMCSEVYISSFEGWKDDLLNNAMPAFVLVFIAFALAVTGLILGIKGLKQAAAEAPVRGLGFSKAGIWMSSIVIVVLLLTFALFIFG